VYGGASEVLVGTRLVLGNDERLCCRNPLTSLCLRQQHLLNYFKNLGVISIPVHPHPKASLSVQLSSYVRRAVREVLGGVGIRAFVEHFENKSVLPAGSNRFRPNHADDKHLIGSAEHCGVAFDLGASDFADYEASVDAWVALRSRFRQFVYLS